MSIHIKRLDFTSTISALLYISARHAVTSDGAHQQALDEIAASLNNVSAIIARHRLADLLDAPIPPIPAQPATDDDSDGPQPEDEPTSDQPDLHPGQAAVLRYIRTHPGCTSQEIAEDCDMKVPTMITHIYNIRKLGIKIISTNTRPTHYHIQETQL